MTKKTKVIYLHKYVPLFKHVEYKYQRLNLSEGDMINFGNNWYSLTVKNSVLKIDQALTEFLDTGNYLLISQLKDLTVQEAEDVFFKAWQEKCNIRYQKRINRIFSLIAVLLCWLTVLGFISDFDYQSEKLTPMIVLGSWIIGFGMFGFVLWFKTYLEDILLFAEDKILSIEYVFTNIFNLVLKTFQNLYTYFWRI
jgi:hypothetical protein